VLAQFIKRLRRQNQEVVSDVVLQRIAILRVRITLMYITKTAGIHRAHACCLDEA
jgi:hypothetical protein